MNTSARTYSGYVATASGGITFNDTTQVSIDNSTTGNRMGLTIASARVITGTGLGVIPTLAATASASTTDDPAGAGLLVKITGNNFSGHVYSAEPSTAFNCSTNNLTLSFSVNGAAPMTSTCIASDGSWSNAVSVSSGDVMNVWVSGQGSGTVYGETLYITDATAKTDINLWQNTLAIRYDTGLSITNANLSTGRYSTKGQQIYAISSGNLTVDSNDELHVWTGDTFVPEAM